jgi:hypothetical protein
MPLTFQKDGFGINGGADPLVRTGCPSPLFLRRNRYQPARGPALGFGYSQVCSRPPVGRQSCLQAAFPGRRRHGTGHSQTGHAFLRLRVSKASCCKAREIRLESGGRAEARLQPGLAAPQKAKAESRPGAGSGPRGSAPPIMQVCARGKTWWHWALLPVDMEPATHELGACFLRFRVSQA